MGDLPQDFDPVWYAQRYPDVGLSGLSPQEHYRRFGRHFGRNANGKSDKRLTVERKPQTVTAPPAITGSRTVGMRSRVVGDVPIIDRPADLEPPERRLDPFATNADPGSSLNVTALIAENADQAILAYSRLARLKMPESLNDEPVSCAAEPFQAGSTRIENAWYAGRSRLRLMLAGCMDPSNGPPVVLRAYQAKGSNRGELLPLGARQLPDVGPVFHDFELLQALMPVLLELSGADGTVTRSLMPFPSLLPGGLHNVELKAFQTEANPIDGFWSYSEALLREAVDGRDSPQLRVATVVQDAGSDFPLTDEVNEWLQALLTGEVEPDGLRLSLPANSVPTISSMVARHHLGSSGFLAGPYLMADAESFRPRWSVVPPVSEEPWAGVPVIGSSTAGGREGRPAPIPLGIVLHRPVPIGAIAPDTGVEASMSSSMSVVVEVTDISRAEATLQAIKDAAGKNSAEFLIRLHDDNTESRCALDRICGVRGWSAVPSGTDLRDLAQSARHDFIFIVSDRIRMDDASAIATLLATMEADPEAGSASCVLLGETIVKRQTVITPACGGLFPAGVSFATSPRLSFWEPDVLEALPRQTYPVVANTMHFTLFRKEALVKVAQSGKADDIRLGLDLIEAGYRNWCTTKATATLMGGYVRRDSIDPIGGAYAEPGRWQELLPRVALLRQLY